MAVVYLVPYGPHTVNRRRLEPAWDGDRLREDVLREQSLFHFGKILWLSVLREPRSKVWSHSMVNRFDQTIELLIFVFNVKNKNVKKTTNKKSRLRRKKKVFFSKKVDFPYNNIIFSRFNRKK